MQGAVCCSHKIKQNSLQIKTRQKKCIFSLMHWIADCVPMKSKDSSGKNKALKIFSHEYDSKLNRSVHVPLTDGSLAPNISKKKG